MIFTLKRYSLILFLALILMPSLSFAGKTEGRVIFLYRYTLLLDDGKDTHIISIKGLGREDLRQGDRVTITYSQEIAGVKMADEMHLRPLVPIEPKLVVSAEELASLIERGEGYVLIDARQEERYDQGHIPSALSIPDSTFEKNHTALPKNKKMLMVFYSDGPRCPMAFNSLKKALALGYKNVKVYNEGEPGWVRGGHYTFATPAYIRKQLEEDKPLLLIDVRSYEASFHARIPGAVSMPVYEMDGRKEEFFSDYWEEPVVIYGENGGDIQALESARKVIDWGYHLESNSNANVNVLEGGFRAWNAAGYQTEKEGIRTSIVHTPRPSSGEISFEEFKKIWEGRSPDVLLLDVRSTAEIYEYDPEKKGVLNIPYDELHLRISELPKDGEIIAYCASGYRALLAYHILKKNGFHVRFLQRDLRIRKDGTVE